MQATKKRKNRREPPTAFAAVVYSFWSTNQSTSALSLLHILILQDFPLEGREVSHKFSPDPTSVCVFTYA